MYWGMFFFFFKRVLGGYRMDPKNCHDNRRGSILVSNNHHLTFLTNVTKLDPLDHWVLSREEFLMHNFSPTTHKFIQQNFE
jgi:hypothetical protein